MPGLLLTSTLVACVVGGAPDNPINSERLSAFGVPSVTDRGGMSTALRPPIDLDAEVLLYSGMPIEIDGETKYVGNLGTYFCLNSLAVSEDGRLAAIVAYSDTPQFPYIEVDGGLAVVREEPDGTFRALATKVSPIVGYPNGEVQLFGFPTETQSRSAFLSDGSYRTLARLQFGSPDVSLSGDWIVDIDDEGIHPVLRLEWHELPDGSDLSVRFDSQPQTDFSLPVGGIGSISGTPGQIGWRLEGREVVLLANLLDNPLTNSTPALSSGRFVVPLTDGSILTPFGLASETRKSFYARVDAEGVHEEFECSRGQFPALADGSERLVFSQYRGHAIEDGYFAALRGLVGNTLHEVTIAKFGDEIRRFLDNQTFDAFPPFDSSSSVQAILSTNNRGDVIAWRGTDPEVEFTSHALFFSGLEHEWRPVVATGQAQQLGVYSGGYGIKSQFDSALRRTITHDGTFVFSVDTIGYSNPGHIAWSLEGGYRLVHARGDFLTLPGDPVRPIQPFWKHVGQNPLNTTLFAVAQFVDDPDVEFKIAIIRQSLDSAHPLADLNRDGEVNALDLNIVIRGMSGGGTYEFSGDIDFDGAVDENDLQMLLDQWGER